MEQGSQSRASFCSMPSNGLLNHLNFRFRISAVSKNSFRNGHTGLIVGTGASVLGGPSDIVEERGGIEDVFVIIQSVFQHLNVRNSRHVQQVLQPVPAVNAS